jgi:hypothetical protein
VLPATSHAQVRPVPSTGGPLPPPARPRPVVVPNILLTTITCDTAAQTTTVQALGRGFDKTRDIVITFQLFYEFGFASGGVAYTLNPDHSRGERRTAPNLGSWAATYTTPPVAARWWEGAAVYVAQWVAVRATQNNGTNVVVSARCAFRR